VGFFEPALREMAQSNARWRKPQSVANYLKQYGLDQDRRTAELLSVQAWSQLDKDLRDASVMVFRLGVGTSQSAHFALAKADRDLASEFFLCDDSIFQIGEEAFVPDASVRDLYPFQLLGRVNEDGAVDLAIVSGLLAQALDIDPPSPRVAPARTASAFSFQVRPHFSYPEVVWDHVAGQVEVDAAFLAKRAGKWKLFVIEAKCGEPTVSCRLPKYKLVYSASVLAQRRLPKDIEIVPVYLRSWQDADLSHIHYAIVECDLGNRDSPVVAALVPREGRRFVMPFGGMLNGA
jgi:hypothetical protein